MIVPLLQAIFAMLLVSGKSLHELPLQITRLSKLSQPSILSHPQAEVSLFPSSLCPSCQTQSRVCWEVSSIVNATVNTASDGVVWLRQVCATFYRVKEVTMRTLTQLGRVRVKLTLGLGGVAVTTTTDTN